MKSSRRQRQVSEKNLCQRQAAVKPVYHHQPSFRAGKTLADSFPEWNTDMKTDSLDQEIAVMKYGHF